MKRRIVLVAASLLFLTGCAQASTIVTPPPKEIVSLEMPLAQPAQTITSTPAPTATPTPTPEPTITPDPWTEEEVEAIARTLSGECYENKPEDKRLVAEVILNRVSNERWDDTVIEVVTAKSQFHGYWHPSRSVSDNDREIAVQALRDWYANDCVALSEYLYFSAGTNHENVFRKNY